MTELDNFDDAFDPGMPTTCRCGRLVDFNEMVDAPEGEKNGVIELVCKWCAEEEEE